MEVNELLVIVVPYIFLGGLSAFSAEVSKTPQEMRPVAFNSVVIESGLALYWVLMIIASIAIFIIGGFKFIALLFVLSLVLSPITKLIGKNIYYKLVVTPIDNRMQKEASPSIPIVWGRLLFLPALFMAWIIYITFYLL